jgi:hypothetical protein
MIPSAMPPGAFQAQVWGAGATSPPVAAPSGCGSVAASGLVAAGAGSDVVSAGCDVVSVVVSVVVGSVVGCGCSAGACASGAGAS